MMLNINQISKLREAAVAAYECEKQTRIPCEMTIAQWALESGWGDKSPGNNCFGIKAHIGYPSQLLTTHEYLSLDEIKIWLTKGIYRSASVDGSVPIDAHGRRRYLCTDSFAAYPSILDCFLDHSRLLLRGFYSNCLSTFNISGDLTTYIQNVSRAYATDPSYENSILAIISMPEVIAALQEVRK